MKTHTMTAVAAGAIGYVLGAKAGRERYEQIMRLVRTVAGDPRVRDAAQRAQEKAQAVAPGVADHVADAARRHGPGGDERKVDRSAPAAATDPVPGG
jgi:hypothetical protein